MIVRALILGCIIAASANAAGERSDLTITGPVEGPNYRVFEIHGPEHKHVLVFVKNGAVSTLDVTASFPYSVTLTESPTQRYKAVIIFEDRPNNRTIDSFGITSASELERTDEETHKALVESGAKGRAGGEQIGKEIREQRH